MSFQGHMNLFILLIKADTSAADSYCRKYLEVYLETVNLHRKAWKHNNVSFTSLLLILYIINRIIIPYLVFLSGKIVNKVNCKSVIFREEKSGNLTQLQSNLVGSFRAHLVDKCGNNNAYNMKQED